jgi:hypothetical protein
MYSVTLTSSLAGHGIILHVCCSETTLVDEYGDIQELWRQEHDLKDILNNTTDS